MYACSPHMYDTGIVWSLTCTYGPPHVKYLHVLYDSYHPHTLCGIGIIWFPTGTYGPPYLIWSVCHKVSPHVRSLHVLYGSYGPPYLYGIGIIGSPTCMYGPSTCMYGPPPHVQYDVNESYGPPYLTWNVWYRYCMSPTCLYGPPHVKCLHVLYDSYGSPIPYMEYVSYVPYMYI